MQTDPARWAIFSETHIMKLRTIFTRGESYVCEQ